MKNFVFRGNEYYKRKIIEMVDGISDVWILKQIFRCIVNITKEG